MYQGWEMAKERVNAESPELTGDEYWNKVVEYHDEFVRLTQSTSEEMDSTAEQDAPILGGVVMFSSAISKQWQMMRKIIWDLKDAVKTKDSNKALFAIESAAAVVLMQGLTEGTKILLRNTRSGEGDEPEEFARKAALATVLGLMQNRILFGTFIASLSLPGLRDLIGVDQKIYQNDMFVMSIFDDLLNLSRQLEADDREKATKTVIRLASSLGISLDGLVQTHELLKGTTEFISELE
jgi:hypothetical protein